MARRSQCSSAGDNPLDPNYLPPHYREEYRLAVDALVEDSLKGYYQCLQNVDVVDFLSPSEIQYIQSVVQPPKQSILSEQQFLDSEGEGSSDTYWPIHSDLDVPGLDLGWPQIHHFIEPTEVTTLVNPPEPDMPSIKEQARRLIKNAQQVIAIVMDMFTDVDIFADILNAAGRRVAVYILLDEQNADLFVNMVANCRVNLQAFPFIRLRTVSGITYQCRSGKSFKGQMMDRFLLTDCRAVLSGNYSFMWSFEKLHRCMAHLFLGQLVTTFDEEFRILFAQSQPLNVEHMLAQMEDLKVLQQKQFPNESTSLYREPKRFISVDIPSDDWGGHLYDEPPDGNLRIMALNRQGSLRGPADVYNRFGSQQSRMDPSFDQGPSRHLMTDNPALKRHSYTEDVPGRYPFPLMPQQGMPDSETRGKPLHWGQQPFPGPGPGPEEDYSSYDKFWNQGYLPEQYPVPALQQEVPPEFDPVLNYLSSTRNLDVDQGIDKLQPPVDFSFTSPQPKRLGIGQPYACQTSPTPSNSADQKPFFHDLTLNRKDPTVKQKLRNWRIGSYLSTYDNPEEEGLPMVSTQPTDTFEEPLNPNQQTAQLPDLPASKIPNVKEFKVTTVPRVMVIETKTAPASSETSYTAEGRKTEEEDQKLPISTGLQRDDSFRRKYNPGGLRTSRLRSSLIFSSLEQQTPQETTTADQDDEEGDKTKTEQAKLPLVAQVLGQRRSTAREPFEWSRYIKSTLETLKPDDVSKKEKNKDASKGKNSQDLADNPEVKESIKPTDVEQDNISLSMPQVNESGPEGSVSEPDLEKTVSSVTVPVDNQPADVPTETGSLESTESPKASLLEKSELPQEVAIQTAPSSNLKITDLATLSVPKTLSSSSTSESDQSGLDPEDKVSVTSVSTEQNLSDTNSISNDSQPKSEESFDQPTAQSLSSPSEPTTVAPADADFPCKISEAVTPQNQTPEPAAPQESSKKEAELGETDEKKSNDLEDKDKSQKPSTEDPASREKTKDQSKQSICSETTEVTSKQPKSSQSRYHSSTVNVITSSNLRDDTKLLLEKISAQSQSRNEATKESPVTDDEKEDNADKKARNEKELGYRTYNRGQTKSTQEKEKLLERIQSMRKERKVYSRFEVGMCYQFHLVDSLIM
uniref:Protein FAM83H-like n=1 Tax=Poecilia latipinna TaxID=48699 RepID=A0A3B3VY37_9TELE